MDGGSKRQIEKRWWLWTLKLRRDGDSECRNWEEIVVLNAKMKNNGFEGQNVEKWWLWMLNKRHGYECQTTRGWWEGICLSVTCRHNSRSINHKAWRSIITIWMPLTQDTLLEEPIAVSKEWPTGESQEK